MKIKSWVNQWTKPNIVKLEGIRIKIPQNTSEVIRQALWNHTYEAAELQLVKRKLAPDDIVMEIGTGLGLLSAYCAKQIGNERVFTFEANPSLEDPIKTNYALNQVAPSLEMSLVGERAGERNFYVGKNFWSGSIFNKKNKQQPITVRVQSFNQKIKEINPTFLLIDIEGGEHELVQYADFHNLRKLMIEMHSWILSSAQIQEVKDKLHQAGFRFVEQAGKEELYFEREPT